LFLLIAGLLALHLAIATNASLLRRRAAIAIACLAALPLTLGPVVPIAHFILEAIRRPLLWSAQTFAALLVLALVSHLAIAMEDGYQLVSWVPFFGNQFNQTLLLKSPIWLSDDELGQPTPGLWDEPTHIGNWLAAAAECVLLAFSAWSIQELIVVYCGYPVLNAALAHATLSR